MSNLESGANNERQPDVFPSRTLRSEPGKEVQTAEFYGARLARALRILKQPELSNFQRKLADKMANASFQALDQLGQHAYAVQMKEFANQKE